MGSWRTFQWRALTSCLLLTFGAFSSSSFGSHQDPSSDLKSINPRAEEGLDITDSLKALTECQKKISDLNKKIEELQKKAEKENDKNKQESLGKELENLIKEHDQLLEKTEKELSEIDTLTQGQELGAQRENLANTREKLKGDLEQYKIKKQINKEVDALTEKLNQAKANGDSKAIKNTLEEIRNLRSKILDQAESELKTNASLAETLKDTLKNLHLKEAEAKRLQAAQDKTPSASKILPENTGLNAGVLSGTTPSQAEAPLPTPEPSGTSTASAHQSRIPSSIPSPGLEKTVETNTPPSVFESTTDTPHDSAGQAGTVTPYQALTIAEQKPTEPKTPENPISQKPFDRPAEGQTIQRERISNPQVTSTTPQVPSSTLMPEAETRNQETTAKPNLDLPSTIVSATQIPKNENNQSKPMVQNEGPRVTTEDVPTPREDRQIDYSIGNVKAERFAMADKENSVPKTPNPPPEEPVREQSSIRKLSPIEAGELKLKEEAPLEQTIPSQPSQTERLQEKAAPEPAAFATTANGQQPPPQDTLAQWVNEVDRQNSPNQVNKFLGDLVPGIRKANRNSKDSFGNLVISAFKNWLGL